MKSRFKILCLQGGGCPTAFQEAAQVRFLPQGRADRCEEAREAMIPYSQPGAEAQQYVGQQRRPELPAHGALVVAEKVGQEDQRQSDPQAPPIPPI